MIKKFMTKREVVKSFIDTYKNRIPRGDVITRYYEWYKHTDILCKGNKISKHQNDKWTNPFETN